MLKKTTYILTLIFFLSSCANTYDSVKRGLTGEKQKSTDEFLIQKKDPLILPPDYENLPLPGDEDVTQEEISNFEKSLESAVEIDPTTSSSTEESILEKIRSK